MLRVGNGDGQKLDRFFHLLEVERREISKVTGANFNGGRLKVGSLSIRLEDSNKRLRGLLNRALHLLRQLSGIN